MSQKCKILILEPSLSEFGPSAIVQIAEPNGDVHLVRCLCRPEGVTEVGEPTGANMLDYLTERYGSDMISSIREATIEACSRSGGSG